MAFGSIGAPGGRRSRGVVPLAEINVTPFVDVALVLLIIFMITAHVIEYGIDVDVPKTKSVAASTKESPVIVNVTKDGNLFLGKDPANLSLLVRDIRAKYPGQDAVFLRGASETPWEIIANVMSVLGEAKFAVKAVTQTDDNRGRRR
jgi:biopolymer transport protein ExbD